ncbi:FkbM family methyltransferase [Bradyrhizobium canariense]|uniref:class I SAM-dependent methyltransferase n=1 Tax=Bradyrhizobium TaxID=374 RepID=UPI001C683808|nr:class I SAM-dependent methyltransferase [Bradyrhizobium canariense]MBW5439543.1 FkbM family methyltransferase [Bradyrhizobium canariense]
MSEPGFTGPKAKPEDLFGRFREIVSDPLNLLIERVPMAGLVEGDQVYLHNGLKVPGIGPGAYYGPFSSVLIINRGVHEPLEEYVFQELLKRLGEAPSMIELGAYWGHYSMWLKKARPKAEVILVEPDPACLKTGQDNFARNGLRAEFVKAFVGKGKFEVDAFFRDRKIKHLDILHADIQAFEVEMLQGAESVLAKRRVDYLFIATHSQALHDEVVDRLKAHGYRVEISSDFEEQSTSFDGFVFASSPEVDALFGEIEVMGRREIALRQPADVLRSLNGLLEAGEARAVKGPVKEPVKP